MTYTYPSEESFLDMSDDRGDYPSTANAIQNERDRLRNKLYQENIEAAPVETINLITEGENFHAHFDRQDGDITAILF